MAKRGNAGTEHHGSEGSLPPIAMATVRGELCTAGGYIPPCKQTLAEVAEKLTPNHPFRRRVAGLHPVGAAGPHQGMHPDPLQPSGMQGSSQDAGRAGCSCVHGAEPPAPSAQEPPPLPGADGVSKAAANPAPSTYFLPAGGCVLQQGRDRRDLGGRRWRICVSAPCFMAPEEEAGSSRST